MALTQEFDDIISIKSKVNLFIIKFISFLYESKLIELKQDSRMQV